MRRFFITLFLAILSIHTYAQTDSSYTSRKHVRHGLGAVTITGISLTGASHIVGIVGLATLISEGQKSYSPYENRQKVAPAILGTGAAMFITGVTMAIVGGIHDYRRAHRSSLSIVAPKGNELGVAWNF